MTSPGRQSSPTRFDDLPTSAAWRHHHGGDGFEVAWFHPTAQGVSIRGATSAVEGGGLWHVRYAIDVDNQWVTRRVEVTSLSDYGSRRTVIDADGHGRWRVNGRHSAEMDCCLDIDLESSAMTNTLPLHRLYPDLGILVDTPAVYVRAATLDVEHLDQTYRRLPAEAGSYRYHYTAASFGFGCVVVMDAAGLVLDYPGIATRSA
ncbi:hypothetical protein FOS14_03935 [Skermania sp. ID1734]|uniref:putative glycolipid-binding domain-containing protein n=1 Tax=Skermania sp. ID1734 TaxID=2597516 RepID=UPI00117C8800|nr:putative glycolipid-binding domain-containing protein [Skermania sp. ID1734]TSE01678.1 hypothetical protein FOS14_03935 [Skermania sp. ID1734]